MLIEIDRTLAASVLLFLSLFFSFLHVDMLCDPLSEAGFIDSIIGCTSLSPEHKRCENLRKSLRVKSVSGASKAD